jgi:hypothetical protein
MGQLTVRRRIPFNLCPECADGSSMSDVEATRYMASEREIEFVDLDTYGVDPTAAAILPVGISRRHRVVAVKRKFGTPVIATADPDDLLAVDSILACLGRDFISVVASPEQIDHYIDLAFREGGPVAASPTSLGDLAVEIGESDDAFDQAIATVEHSAAAGAPLPTLDLPPPSVATVPPIDPSLAGPIVPGPAGDDQLADLARRSNGTATDLVPTPRPTTTPPIW